MDFDDFDIPKHRKKSQKRKSEKSNHKHNYQIDKLENTSKGRKNDGTDLYWVSYYEVCDICGKVRYDNKFMNEDEYQGLLDSLQ